MDSQFWHERWQRNEIGFHQDAVNAHLTDFWPGLGFAPDSRIFVPLCGKSRDLLWLRSCGHRVYGVELSPIAVRDFFRENALDPQITRREPFEAWEADGLCILCGDFFALTPSLLAEVAGVYDRASLIALPPAMRPRYAQHLTAILPATASMLLVTLNYPDGEMNGPPFAVHEPEVRQLYEPSRRVSLLLTKDVLAENARFRERGLTDLREQVYRIDPLSLPPIR